MQQYMLVGCSAFAVWEEESSDSSLLVARNFDFYMGEDFAHNKLLTFAVPDSGYRYVSVVFPGMFGVLSGMNSQGLMVTINAAKCIITTVATTPISSLHCALFLFVATISTVCASA